MELTDTQWDEYCAMVQARPRLLEAIRLLGAYTANRFDVWTIAGNARASCRAHVMSALLGRKTPQSKSGVNAINDEFHRLAGIGGGGCEAARESMFIDYCRAITAQKVSA